jgi:RNA 3'-terminal phosphate cyclase (ATP)
MGVDIEGSVANRGFYPAGCGEVSVRIRPCEKPALPRFEDTVREVRGNVVSAALPAHIPRRVQAAALCELREFEARTICTDVSIESAQAASPGVGIVLWTNGLILGADRLGERGTPAEVVGATAAKDLIADVRAGARLDPHMVDQLLPYLVFTNRTCTFSCRQLTAHAKSEIWLLKQFYDRDFIVKEDTLLSTVTVQP